MKVLITGGAGFIGSSFAKYLIKKYPIYEVHVIDDLSKGKKEELPDNVKFTKSDLSERNCLDFQFNYDFIFHFAGQSSGERSFEDQLQDAKSNYLSTINIVEFANKNKCHNLIFASSMSIYGDVQKGPKTPYGLNKLHSENYIKRFFEGHYKILRLNNIYGPGQDLEDMMQGMVSIFLGQALESDNIVVKGSLSRLRDFVWINDLLTLLDFYLHSSSSTNSVIDVASGCLTSVGELLVVIQSILGKKQIKVIGGTKGDQNVVKQHKDTLKEIIGEESITIQEGIKIWLSKIRNI